MEGTDLSNKCFKHNVSFDTRSEMRLHKSEIEHTFTIFSNDCPTCHSIEQYPKGKKWTGKINKNMEFPSILCDNCLNQQNKGVEDE